MDGVADEMLYENAHPYMKFCQFGRVRRLFEAKEAPSFKVKQVKRKGYALYICDYLDFFKMD